jgi:hypothetical protein
LHGSEVNFLWSFFPFAKSLKGKKIKWWALQNLFPLHFKSTFHTTRKEDTFIHWTDYFSIRKMLSSLEWIFQHLHANLRPSKIKALQTLNPNPKP